MSIICQTSLSVLDGGCAQGVFGRAGFCSFPGLLTCVQLPPHSFSSDVVTAQLRKTTDMFKVTPNPPGTPDPKLHQAAQRALDHYLNPSLKTAPPSAALFSVAADASSESLITNSYETFSSVSALLLDLSEELSGKDRDVALAIHQLSELGVLLMGKLMDREVPCS